MYCHIGCIFLKITDNFETCLKSTERRDYVDVKSASKAEKLIQLLTKTM